MYRLLLVAAALSVAGCSVGAPPLSRVWPARSPAGVEVRLLVRDYGPLRGELLAVEDTALILLVDDLPKIVPNRRIVRGGTMANRITWDGRETHAHRRVLRRYARFSLGMPPEARRALGL